MNKGFLTRGGGLISLIIVVVISCSAWLLVSHLSTVKKVSTSDAFSSSNTSSYKQVDELLLDPTSATATKPFNIETMTTLVNMIYGSSGDMNTQIDSLTTSVGTTPLTAANLRAKTYNKTNGQSIVVRLGGLDWIVTYVSKDTDNNLVATLWLSNNHQEAWSGQNRNLGDHYGIANGGLYSDWSDDWYSTSVGTYPSNMYGTSYIRVATLNNTGTGNKSKYATSTSALSSTVTQSSSHIFSLYTVESKGLTRFLSTPSKMPWMTNMQNPANRNQTSYWLNNESLTTTNGYSYSGSWYSSDYNYTGKTDYANWGDDYLWLPSMAEMGYSDTYDGLWETNTAERTTYDGSTESFSTSYIGSSQSSGSGTAYCYTWGRSAYYNDASYSYFLYPSGSSYYYIYVSLSQAVRPSLLISLNSAASLAAGRPWTVTLDSEGGSGGTNQISVALGDGFPAVTAPVKNGYIFGGYYTAASGGGSKIFDENGQGAVSSSPFNSNTTLYAKWTPIMYTVSYNANGGTGTMSNSSHTYDTAKNLTANAFTRTGYTFAGWATSSIGGAVYANSQSVMNLVTTNGATVTLYAVWKGVDITLTFDNQSATTAYITSVTVTYNLSLPSISPPSRTGYVFEGYYTATNGSGTKVYNANGLPVIPQSTFTTNTTLYARWITCSSITVTGSTTQITTSQVFDAEMVNATIMISPAAGHRISEFSFDNTTWYAVDSCRKEICDTNVAICVIYSANENSNALIINFEGIFCDGAIPLYLKTASGAYSGLKSAGGSVSGVVVTATLGGTAYIVGDDFENLEDSDTITISTTLCQPGYAFVGWYLDDDRTTAISTATSYRVAKSVAFEHTLVAVYQPTSNNNVNLETDNT